MNSVIQLNKMTAEAVFTPMPEMNIAVAIIMGAYKRGDSGCLNI